MTCHSLVCYDIGRIVAIEEIDSALVDDFPNEISNEISRNEFSDIIASLNAIKAKTRHNFFRRTCCWALFWVIFGHMLPKPFFSSPKFSRAERFTTSAFSAFFGAVSAIAFMLDKRNHDLAKSLKNRCIELNRNNGFKGFSFRHDSAKGVYIAIAK